MSTSMKLYDLAQQYHELESLADPDIPDIVIQDTLESLGGELTDKVVSIAKFIRNVEASAKAIDEAAEAMHMRAVRANKLAERIKQYILVNMTLAGITKIESPFFTVRVQKNPESVNIAEDALVPEKYMVTPPPPPPKPDKAALKKALQAGVEIEGCWLSQGEHLRIAI